MLVLGVYLLCAVLMLPVLDWVRGLLLLPARFTVLGRWLLVAGAPVAALVAWRYPHLGDAGERDD